MRGIGIFSWFSYDLPIKERFQLIKDAGFAATSLFWAGEEKHKEPDMCRLIGLQIDNIHTPFQRPILNPNSIWYDTLGGDDYSNMLINCVEDCASHEIPTMVIHITSSGNNIPVSKIGFKRIGKIVDIAEKKDINLAFENIYTLEHLDAIFNYFSSEKVGFCWDSGHENWNHPDKDCLALYGNRLLALHIDDNFSDDDSHMLPYDGNINWELAVEKLKKCRDVDYFTLEVDFNRNYDRCKIYNELSAKDFLNLAYEKATKLFRILNLS